MLNFVSCIPYEFVRQADPKDVKLINAVLELVDFGELELQGESLQALPPPSPLAILDDAVLGRSRSGDLSSQIVPHGSLPSPPTTAPPLSKHMVRIGNTHL